MVSIITPSHNSSLHIAQTIESVLTQTYEQWEMIIADDASTDSTPRIVKEYAQKDTRIRLIPMELHSGAAEARNTALRDARGRYIAFLDSDDLWHPQKLERQIEFMQDNGYAFTFTNYQRIKGKRGKKLNVVQVPEQINYSKYLKNTIIGTLTVLIDRQQTGKLEMPDIRSSHDMALWCDIMKRGFKAYGLRETLASYRVMAGSNTARKIRAARDVWKVYRKIERLTLGPAVVNFAFYACNAAKRRI